MAVGMTTQEQLKKQIVRALRRKPQTLAEIAVRIGKGTTVKQLCVPVGHLRQDGEVLRHKGSPARYSKPDDHG